MVTLTTPRIHFIENERNFTKLQNGVWESGYWVLSYQTAQSLVDGQGQIFFHATHTTLSHFGGTLLDFRIVPAGQKHEGRIIFKLQSSETFQGLKAGKGGWSNEKKVVL